MEGVKKTYWDAIKDLEPLKTVRPPKPAAEPAKPAAEKPAEPSKMNHHVALVEMKSQVFPEETCKSHSTIKSLYL